MIDINKLDSDSCDEAWDFYEIFYGKSLDKESKTFTANSITIDVNGDVIFNTKLKKAGKGNRYTLMGSIIKDIDKESFNALKDSLDGLFYSPMNISILPKTGGLNIIKGQFANDRFDSFVWLLSQYYEGVTAPIINRGTKNSYIGQQTILSNFLDKLKNVSKFCECFYGIEDTFIKRLILSGPKAISCKEELYNYYLLACEFWSVRLEKIYNNEGKEIISNDDYESYKTKIATLSVLLNDEIKKIHKSK